MLPGAPDAQNFTPAAYRAIGIEPVSLVLP